ncbi:septal ring lytic transglycosylase RlpA family protein [Anaerocellum danielii]|uniref:septal ring lytic transglycosylase RlpA family protein n=1 Tax=Anaerocellum danielii TaxID=1387557 RepID=UPI00069691AA
MLDSESAAHKSIQFRTKVRVTSLENGKNTIVKILDRGPYVNGRILDMVKTAFSKIHSTSKGIFRGKIEWPI